MNKLSLLVQSEENPYTALSDDSLGDVFRHFFTRGHDGRVTCVDASAQADFIVSGGVDYTVRIWKYDHHHDAYDLYSILVQTPPTSLNSSERTTFQLLKNMVFPAKVDYDLPEYINRGITAVACVGSRYEDPFGEGQPMRNGPVLSGNGNGDFYVHCLYSGKQDEIGYMGEVTEKPSLHAGAINDICVGVTYKNDAKGNKFQIMTAGADGVAFIIEIVCDEIENPSHVDEPMAEGLDKLVSCMVRGGGWPSRAHSGGTDSRGGKTVEHSPREEKVSDEEAGEEEEEEGEEEDKDVLMVTEVSKDPIRCDHDGEDVFGCRFLGDYEVKQPRFATCTKDKIRIWSGQGSFLYTLNFTTDSCRMSTYNHEKMIFETAPVSVTAQSHTYMCCVWKKSGTLLCVNGVTSSDGVNGVTSSDGTGSHVAVWGFAEGKLGWNDNGVMKYDDAGSEDNGYQPVCVYQQTGDMTEVDQSGVHTTFICDVRNNGSDLALWSLDAVAPGMLVVEPEGPVSLLICPGREEVILQMNHSSKIIDTTVVEDPAGPALVVGVDDGAVYIWDLSGHDKGQIYGEMRSLHPQEVFLPPILLIVGALQMMSFAFGPAIPWKSTIEQPATVSHQIMMLDFKYTVKIDKELIFWPEIIIILTAAAFFLISALIGLPQQTDAFCRQIQNSARFRDESAKRRGAGPAHLLLKFCNLLSTAMYLFMQLGSTVLVVPMMQTVAQSLACVRPDETSWTDMLTGNPKNEIFLAAAPNIKCWRGNHLAMVSAEMLILPLFLVVLIPYAVCGGDAHYVPTNTLWDFKIWQPDNNWVQAAKRAATDLHLAFLHPNPKTVFRTNLLDLMAKVMLPVVTILLAPNPSVEMCMVTAIGAAMWINVMLYPPYVEKKMTTLVQDLKLFTMLTMACGVVTVYLKNPHSNIPLLGLAASGAYVLVLIVIQAMCLSSSRPIVRKITVGQGAPSAELLAEE